MSVEARILVVSDGATDGDVVRKMLAAEFASVHLSTEPAKAVKDFEKHQPNVLVLAFQSVEKAELCYLGLYRHSELAHTVPHQTLLLCSKEELRRVYELCRDEYFDDYVLFWPLVHDSYRLPMSVRRALRHLSRDARGSVQSELVQHARNVADLGVRLDAITAQGSQHAGAAARQTRQSLELVGAALDRFSGQMASAKGSGTDQLRQAFERLLTDEISPAMHTAHAAAQAVAQRTGMLRAELAPQILSAGAMKQIADQVRPYVLIVDDDPIQHQLLLPVLSGAGYEIASAHSGTQALAALAKRLPDLVLMDVNMPDLDGIEVTRRIRVAPCFDSVPILMLTGHADRGRVLNCIAAGAADFMVKPVDKLGLLEKVRKQLAKPRPASQGRPAR